MSKSSKRRKCPAIGRQISSAECGENRVSHYACPADCVHNPFAPANYSQFLELEGVVDTIIMDRLAARRRQDPVLERDMKAALSRSSPDHVNAAVVWHWFLRRGVDGRTLAEQFAQEGFPGCRNDQRVLLRAKMQTQMVLLEVRRVLDLERAEVIDLFEPEPRVMVVQDRGFAGSAARFDVGLTWTYPLPHYWRLTGTARLLADWEPIEPREVVRELARHLGAPEETGAFRLWLAEHFTRFQDAFEATAHARRRLMFASMDAKFGKAVYELRAPFAQCRASLDEVEDVALDDLSEDERTEGFAEARVWFLKEPPAACAVPEGGTAVLGRVLMGQAHWRLEAMGGARMAQLRERFEAALGERAHFTGERIDDLAARMASEEPGYDRSLVPASLLQHVSRIVTVTSRVPAGSAPASRAELLAKVRRDADQRFLDEPVPALQHKTPREAALDPALRPSLIRLMKSRVRATDAQNLRTGGREDINWMVRELGLTEILFDPPPPRPPPPGFEAEEAEDEDDWREPVEEGRPEAPRLSGPPLTLEEAQQRLQEATNMWEAAEESTRELERSGSTLLEDVHDLTSEILGEQESAFLTVLLMQVWFAFVPRGVRAPELDFDRMREGMLEETRRMGEAVATGIDQAVDRLFAGAGQPNVLKLMLAQLLLTIQNAPKDLRLEGGALPVMIITLRVVVDELDRALRSR